MNGAKQTMNEIQQAAKMGVVDRFLGRLGLGGHNVDILQNPTEEILAELERGRAPSLFGMKKRGKKKAKLVRKEENYLYSTRRFPNNTSNNTIGAGAVVAGDYDFFGNGVGDSGNTMGYSSLTNLTLQQTNMDKGGKIPTGRGFALFELAVSFDATATGANIAQCLDTMHLWFQKQAGAMNIYHGPIRNWPAGTGVAGYAATTATTTTIQQAANGVPTLGGVRRFKNPRVLNANDSFKYVITASANLPKTNAAVALTDFVEISIWLFGFHYDRIPE